MKKKLTLIIFAITMLFLGTSFAQVSVLDSPYCKDLIAGQNIDSGDVCLEVVGENLVVTYTTMDGWELTEAHLWVGENLADMPQNKKGNPKIGLFPYQSGDITGQTYYAFTVPLVELGGPDYMTYLCNKTFYIAAHAAVQKPDGYGGYQTETGWASGDQIVDQGSWAMYFTFQFICGGTPPPPPENCETAFALGDVELWDIPGEDGLPITNRWGWQITVPIGSSFSTPIYAGAAQNDPSKGTYVGDLLVNYDGISVTVEFVMIAPFTMNETHLYVGDVYIDTGAPGLFGNLHDLDSAVYDSYTIYISADPIYIVAHAVVCAPEQ